MANEEHLARLKQGVAAWNQWREAYPGIEADLREAHLSGADLREADLAGAHLTGADLREAHLPLGDLTAADLTGADLTAAYLGGAHLAGANLREAYLGGAHFPQADLTGADLTAANLAGANLYQTNLARAKLHQANMTGALLLETHLEGADLTGCVVYGISAWNLKLLETKQLDLVITPADEPVITVDNLEVAQFIYLLLHNENIRHVIETITSKAVLILGRFTPARKAVLDAIREELRKRDRLPILFDFTPPTGQTLLETVLTLAHMARFIIADLTDAKSILQELTAIVPYNPTLVVQPIILASQEEPGMWDFFRRFPWVLKPYRYHSFDEVRASLEDKIIAPAALKAEELLGR
jgi:uncharacterized protein YjbI with pentapeptide repeats